MSRTRTTQTKKAGQGKQAAFRKNADPYTMNVERSDPWDEGLEVYQDEPPHSDGPDGWAETPQPHNYWQEPEELMDTEVGLPEFKRTTAAMNQRARVAAMMKHSSNAIRISQALFPDAHLS